MWFPRLPPLVLASLALAACAPDQVGGKEDAGRPKDDASDSGDVFDPVTDDATGRLALGTSHSCWLRDSGEVHCWGSNLDGELGDGTTQGRVKPKAVLDLEGIVRVASRSAQNCAIDSDDALWCWGKNNWGQLGGATAANFRTTPVQVAALEAGAARVGVGVLHACAADTAGDVFCWGANTDGALGRGTAASESGALAAASGLSGATELTAGSSFSCALIGASGGVSCWGRNTGGQLGDGSTTTRLVPTAVMGLPAKAKTVVAGVSHACALLEGGDVVCWGANGFGQVGSGAASDAPVTVPTKVSGVNADAVALAAGGQTTCALRQSGAVACWGLNNFKQISGSPDAQRASATDIVGMPSAEFLAVGTSHVCAASGDEVYCWGSNAQGQIGIDSDGQVVATPTKVPFPDSTL